MARNRPGLTPDVHDFIDNIEDKWGNEIKDRTVQPFRDVGQRTAEWPDPPEGAMSITLDTGVIWKFWNGRWRPTNPLPYAHGSAHYVLDNARYIVEFLLNRRQLMFTWENGNRWLVCQEPGTYLVTAYTSCIDNCIFDGGPSQQVPVWYVTQNGVAIFDWAEYIGGRSTIVQMAAGDRLQMDVHWNGLQRVLSGLTVAGLGSGVLDQTFLGGALLAPPAEEEALPHGGASTF